MRYPLNGPKPGTFRLLDPISCRLTFRLSQTWKTPSWSGNDSSTLNRHCRKWTTRTCSRRAQRIVVDCYMMDKHRANLPSLQGGSMSILLAFLLKVSRYHIPRNCFTVKSHPLSISSSCHSSTESRLDGSHELARPPTGVVVGLLLYRSPMIRFCFSKQDSSCSSRQISYRRLPSSPQHIHRKAQWPECSSTACSS